MNYSAWRSRAHTGGTVYLQMIMAANILVYSDIYIVQYVSNILYYCKGCEMYWNLILMGGGGIFC